MKTKAKTKPSQGTTSLLATFLVLLALILIVGLIVFFMSRRSSVASTSDAEQEIHVQEFNKAQRAYAEAKGYEGGDIEIDAFNGQDSQEIVDRLRQSQATQ